MVSQLYLGALDVLRRRRQHHDAGIDATHPITIAPEHGLRVADAWNGRATVASMPGSRRLVSGEIVTIVEDDGVEV